MDRSRQIAELGRLILGGDVSLCVDDEMILDRCALKVAEVKHLLRDKDFNAFDARYLAGESLGVDVPEEILGRSDDEVAFTVEVEGPNGTVATATIEKL